MAKTRQQQKKIGAHLKVRANAPHTALRTSTILGNRALAGCATLLAALTLPCNAFALPQLATGADPVAAPANTIPGSTNIATSGTATYSTSGLGAIVGQTSKRAIIDWHGYDTANNESVQDNFTQTGSVQLNRIYGPATNFQGTFQTGGAGNGTVIFVNNNGFTFGNSAHVTMNNAALIVSTAGISNVGAVGGFMDNTVNTFNFDQGGAVNAVVRVGTTSASAAQITAKSVALLGEGVEINHSSITATGSTLEANGTSSRKIFVGAGHKFDVTVEPGDGLIAFQVTDPALQTTLANAITVSNASTLTASATGGTAAGEIVLAADVLNSVYNNIIQVSGGSGQTKFAANATAGHGGNIGITAKATGGTISNSAVSIGNQVLLDAKSSAAHGGNINIAAAVFGTTYTNTATKGGLVDIRSQATIDAKGIVDGAGHATNDGLVTISGKNNNVYDNNSIFLDGVNIFDVPVGHEAIGTRPVLVSTAMGSSIKPCTLVNGTGDCGDGPAPAPAPAPAPDAPPPDAPPPDAPPPDAAPDAPPPDAPPPDAPPPDAAPDAPPPDAPPPDAPPPDAAPDAPPPDAPPPDAPPPDAAPDAPPPDAPPPDAPPPDAPPPDAAPDAPPPDAPPPDAAPDAAPDAPPPDTEPCIREGDSEGCAPAPLLPAPAPAPTPLPEFNGVVIDPLERKVISLRDESVLDKDFLYQDNPFINAGSLDLSVLNQPGGGISPPAGNFGNLSPAAGGKLAKLSPAAGGIAGDQTISCANILLDEGWTKPTAQAGNCEPTQ